jgi:hypothetical protein
MEQGTSMSKKIELSDQLNRALVGLLGICWACLFRVWINRFNKVPCPHGCPERFMGTVFPIHCDAEVKI